MPVYRVTGGDSTAVIDPSRGGKILSLTGPDGREWLAQPANPSRPPYRGDASFTASDPAGWDECAPSIDSCRLGDRSVPDHGDLWTAQWSVVSSRAGSLELAVAGRSLGYQLTRRITGTSTGIRFDYVASTTGPATPFLWAAHPQFVSPPGSVVELPTQVTVIDAIDPTQPVMPWRSDLASSDSLGEGEYRKLYVDPGTRIESVTLRHPDGAALTMSWSNCPYVGLWFDNGAFSRQPVVAIEPTLGFRDSLSWAVEHGHAPILAPGNDLKWSLEVTINAPI